MQRIVHSMWEVCCGCLVLGVSGGAVGHGLGYRRHLLRVQATFWHAWCLVTATRKERRLQDLHAYVAV